MRFIISLRIRHESVVESRGKAVGIDIGGFLCRHHLPQVPQLHSLILAIAQDVSPITFTINIGQSFGMAHEDASLATVAHAAPIPDLNQSVVRPRIQNVGRSIVPETNSVYIVTVSWYPKYRLLGLDIVDIHRVIRRSSYNFSAISGESDRPYLENVRFGQYAIKPLSMDGITPK